MITHPKYVTWLTICIDLITKVKSLRRKLNLFKHTLCFGFFKIYRIYTSHFFTNLKIASQNAKCEARSSVCEFSMVPGVYILLCLQEEKDTLLSTHSAAQSWKRFKHLSVTMLLWQGHCWIGKKHKQQQQQNCSWCL